MKVLLVKCHKKTIYSYLEPIVCEPLELEYISTILSEGFIEHMILDNLLDGKNFKKEYVKYVPDILILSGYITAVDTILSYAKYVKEINPAIKVIVGGVHAELNYDDYFTEDIDIVAHQSNIKTIVEIIDYLKGNSNSTQLEGINGIAYRKDSQWIVNKKSIIESYGMPIPNRDFFDSYKNKTKYMSYMGVAIIKTSISCPFECNFCYCRKINQGNFSTRNIMDIIEEIKTINAEYIWIVDDTFLISKERTLEFIENIKSNNIKKKFIAYSRVDFIAENPDIITKLKEIGFIEIISGIEDINDRKLKTYNKGTTEDNNFKSIEILRKNKIRMTALFLVNKDFKKSDFKEIRQWIKKMALESYTASIFTPIRGTETYETYKNSIEVSDLSKFDFLHLVMKPTNITKFEFYIQFYLIYLEQIFKSKYIRKFLFSKITHINFGGKNV